LKRGPSHKEMEAGWIHTYPVSFEEGN
jgi:hypothetical protein